MRAIDADALEKEGWSLHRTIRVDKNTEEYQTKPLKKVPTIEPQRKKGKWIPVTRIEKWHKEDGLVGFPPEVKEFPQCTIEWVDATEPDEVDGLRCSECGTVYDFTEARNWCSECGAEMGGTG